MSKEICNGHLMYRNSSLIAEDITCIEREFLSRVWGTDMKCQNDSVLAEVEEVGFKSYSHMGRKQKCLNINLR